MTLQTRFPMTLQKWEPSAYSWIITEDHLSRTSISNFRETAIGVYGPSGATDSDIKKLQAGEGVEFRLYDDDHNLYFTGLFLGDAMSEDAFGPLDDYGSPDSGCTGIKYCDPKTGAWEYL